MNKNDNIEEFLKETFDGFEANVKPDVWQAIQSQLGAKAAASIVSSSAAKWGIGKIIGGIVASAAIVGATVYFSMDKDVQTIGFKEQLQTTKTFLFLEIMM